VKNGTPAQPEGDDVPVPHDRERMEGDPGGGISRKPNGVEMQSPLL